MIEHRRTKVRTPETNGVVERFNGTVLDEFFRIKMRETFCGNVEQMRADLDAWLVRYSIGGPISATATSAANRSRPSCRSSGKKVKGTGYGPATTNEQTSASAASPLP